MTKPKWQYSASCDGNTHVRISFLSRPQSHYTRYAFNVCAHTHKHSLLGSEFKSFLCNMLLPSYSIAMKSANCKQGPHTISHSTKLTRLFLDQILCKIPCVSSRQHSVLISGALFCKHVFAVNSVAMNLLQSASKVSPYHKPTAAGSQGILLLFLDQILCKIPSVSSRQPSSDAQQIIHQPNRRQNPLLPTLLDRDHENRTFPPLSCDGWRFFTEQLFLVVAGAARLLWSCMRK
jgi:hypothetical protein